MLGRVLVVAAVLAVVYVQQLAYLPNTLGITVFTLLAALGLVLAYGIKRFYPAWGRLAFTLASLLAAFVLAFNYASIQASLRLADQLATININQVSKVTLRVYDLPKIQADKISFLAQVISSKPAGVPKFIRVSWSGTAWRGPYAPAQVADLPEIHAGQVWQMALVLRPVTASQNFNAFDYESYSFAAGVRALGRVRGMPKLIDTNSWYSLSVIADTARHHIRKAMAPYLEAYRYGPVLRALAIGDQDGVDDADWLVFNRSGLTHLVSISGSHITMLSGAAAVLVYFIWCRFHWRGRILAERWPARKAAACGAMLVAWVYCLLAGWEIPAQRTFMMLAVVALALNLQLRLNGARILALAAAIVLIMDPWAVKASGFWLSFIAVAVLLAVGSRAQNIKNDKYSGLKLAVRLQLAVTFALAPALAWIFHEISVVSPLANAYAIPVIELLVTPLSLLLATVALIPYCGWIASTLAWLAHSILELIMIPTEWLAGLPTINVPAGPAWIYLLASFGAALALWPFKPDQANSLMAKIIPYQYLAWLAMLPMLCWLPGRPANGTWQLYALDVGQGSAIFLQTAQHNFLFDAGVRHNRESDQGNRIILPFLKSIGVSRLDVLVASHADLDHTGGIRSILEQLPVEQSFSSFDLGLWLQHESKKLDLPMVKLPNADSYCQYGVKWQIDGVSFEFLWPLDAKKIRSKKDGNNASCVLRIRGKYHSALLTGDIEAETESILVDRGITGVDLVVAAHHGSKTSSSKKFVTAIYPNHTLIQAGRWNRHQHPHNIVLHNWHQADSQIWRTDTQGAIRVDSHKTGLKVYSVIDSFRRYWHARLN